MQVIDVDAGNISLLIVCKIFNVVDI